MFAKAGKYKLVRLRMHNCL